MSRTANRSIPSTALAVLADGEVRSGVFFLPPGQLERKLYDAVNEVLTALGGRWDRRAKGHVFADDPATRIAAAVATGSYDDPKRLAFFATPPDLARSLVERAAVTAQHLCLEPSAGEGAIAAALVAVCGPGRVKCIEIDQARAATCARRLRVSAEVADFLEWGPAPAFDRVVMNPPFAVPGRPRADIDHVEHALRFLKPDGLLVSVMSGGIVFRTDRRTAAFRQAVECRGGTIEQLPDGAFSDSGTDVRTVVVEIPGGGGA